MKKRGLILLIILVTSLAPGFIKPAEAATRPSGCILKVSSSNPSELTWVEMGNENLLLRFRYGYSDGTNVGMTLSEFFIWNGSQLVCIQDTVGDAGQHEDLAVFGNPGQKPVLLRDSFRVLKNTTEEVKIRFLATFIQSGANHTIDQTWILKSGWKFFIWNGTYSVDTSRDKLLAETPANKFYHNSELGFTGITKFRQIWGNNYERIHVVAAINQTKLWFYAKGIFLTWHQVWGENPGEIGITTSGKTGSYHSYKHRNTHNYTAGEKFVLTQMVALPTDDLHDIIESWRDFHVYCGEPFEPLPKPRSFKESAQAMRAFLNYSGLWGANYYGIPYAGWKWLETNPTVWSSVWNGPFIAGEINPPWVARALYRYGVYASDSWAKSKGLELALNIIDQYQANGSYPYVEGAYFGWPKSYHYEKLTWNYYTVYTAAHLAALYEASGNAAILSSLEKEAKYIIRYAYANGTFPVEVNTTSGAVTKGAQQLGMMPAMQTYVFGVLYQATGNNTYLTWMETMADYIEENHIKGPHPEHDDRPLLMSRGWSPNGDYDPSSFMLGMLKAYEVTGKSKYLTAAKNLADSWLLTQIWADETDTDHPYLLSIGGAHLKGLSCSTPVEGNSFRPGCMAWSAYPMLLLYQITGDEIYFRVPQMGVVASQYYQNMTLGEGYYGGIISGWKVKDDDTFGAEGEAQIETGWETASNLEALVLVDIMETLRNQSAVSGVNLRNLTYSPVSTVLGYLIPALNLTSVSASTVGEKETITCTFEGPELDGYITQPARAIVVVKKNGRTHYNWQMNQTSGYLRILGLGSLIEVRIIDPHPVIVQLYMVFVSAAAALSGLLVKLRRRLSRGMLIVLAFSGVALAVLLIVYAPRLAGMLLSL